MLMAQRYQALRSVSDNQVFVITWKAAAGGKYMVYTPGEWERELATRIPHWPQINPGEEIAPELDPGS